MGARYGIITTNIPYTIRMNARDWSKLKWKWLVRQIQLS